MVSAAGLAPFPGSLLRKAHATFSSSVSSIIYQFSPLGKSFGIIFSILRQRLLTRGALVEDGGRRLRAL